MFEYSSRVHSCIRDQGTRRQRAVLDEHITRPTAGSAKAVAEIYRRLIPTS